MSTFYLKRINAVFIHIPKTGGTSIRDGVFAGQATDPFHWEVWPREWPRNRSFAIVRDPIDRFVSGWKDKAPSMSAEEVFEIVSLRRGNYTRPPKTVSDDLVHHLIPQTAPEYQLSKARFVGRLETLSESWDAIMAALEVKDCASLPRLRKSVRRGVDIAPELRTQLEEYYREDYEWIRSRFGNGELLYENGALR